MESPNSGRDDSNDSSYVTDFPSRAAWYGGYCSKTSQPQGTQCRGAGVRGFFCRSFRDGTAAQEWEGARGFAAVLALDWREGGGLKLYICRTDSREAVFTSLPRV